MRSHPSSSRRGGIFAKLPQALRHLLDGLQSGEPYRPEKHYMRGPGPKSRAVTNGHGILKKDKARGPDAA